MEKWWSVVALENTINLFFFIYIHVLFKLIVLNFYCWLPAYSMTNNNPFLSVCMQINSFALLMVILCDGYSIYNHIQEFIQRLLGRTRRSRREDSRRSKPTVETRNLVSSLMCEF